jgi:hypothetical protein
MMSTININFGSPTDPLWRALTELSRMVRERRHLSQRYTDCDERNDTWTAGHVCGDIHAWQERYDAKYEEVQKLKVGVPEDVFRSMVSASYRLYN